MNDLIIAKEFTIKGVVQGVGFRPFIFQLACCYGLKGEVFNTSKGVTIIVEVKLSDINKIEQFSSDIVNKKPLLAIVSGINCREISPSYYKDFVISKSVKLSLVPEISKNNLNKVKSYPSNIRLSDSSQVTFISPDVSVCNDCINEMQDPNDRRFGYPFINCTNCGPRYTIIKDTPYDRAKTSMSVFKMCKECQKEYDDPLNRRFHAQPNACHVCGPHLFIVDKLGKVVIDDKKENNNYQSFNNNAHFSINSLEHAAKLLKQGKILAIKGLGGFHLAVDAMNKESAAELRKRKKRPHKPFALMARSVEAIEHLVDISSKEKELLQSYHRPIVLLAKKEHILLSDEIAPNNPFLGIMLPYTPLHYLLLEKGPPLLVMTSGNRSGEPISIENQDALDAFAHIADYFLLNNRDIYFRADDSIMQVQSNVPRFFRRSRGYAPLPLILKQNINCPPNYTERNALSVLGCGAGLKNTVCLTSGNMAFLSQHIGDLENEKVFEFYKNSINHLKKIFNIEPDIIAHDLHPEYLSTKFAISLKKEQVKIEEPTKCAKLDAVFIPVQHHHAHAVSCMADNEITGDVIAIVLDGTGLGTDGNIWGGEILVCNEKDFKRKAHLQYIPMPGGDIAAKEPWRMAVSYLYKAFEEEIFNLNIPFLKEYSYYQHKTVINFDSEFSNNKIANSRLNFIIQMINKNINCPLTSSCGRLFDAVASLCSIRHKITFESQAAIELQSKSRFTQNCESYTFAVNRVKEQISINNQIRDSRFNKDDDYKTDTTFIIDFIPSIKDIVKDIGNNVDIETIASKFHQTIIESFVCAAKKINLETDIKQVVLSGGVFNNMLILNGMIHALEKNGFKVYSHSRVPSGDGGISLGQAVIASMSYSQ